MPGGTTIGTDGSDDLVGFARRDAGIIGASDNHQRDFDLASAEQRADFLQFCTLFGDAFVAIFHAPQIAAIGFGVFQKSNEIGDADDFQSGF